MNGRNVRLWQDRWLSSLSVGHPTPLRDGRVSRNMRVNTIICETSGNWDIDTLKPFISEEDFDVILDTCIGDLLMEDRLVWPGNRNGLYTVHSGYHRKHVFSMP